MKINSFLLLFTLFATATVFTACRKEECKLTNAVITGQDYRKCACCGGYLINFREDPQSYQGEEFMVQQNMHRFGIDENAKFPLYVKVAYEEEKNNCGGGTVKINKLEFR